MDNEKKSIILLEAISYFLKNLYYNSWLVMLDYNKL